MKNKLQYSVIFFFLLFTFQVETKAASGKYNYQKLQEVLATFLHDPKIEHYLLRIESLKPRYEKFSAQEIISITFKAKGNTSSIDAEIQLTHSDLNQTLNASVKIKNSLYVTRLQDALNKNYHVIVENPFAIHFTISQHESDEAIIELLKRISDELSEIIQTEEIISKFR